VTRGKFLFVEGRLQQRSYEDRDGQKREATEVVISTLRVLGPPKNGKGSKPADSTRNAEPVDEGDNPFNVGEASDQEIPF
jgi:single-strand DNA-binding protein